MLVWIAMLACSGRSAPTPAHSGDAGIVALPNDAPPPKDAVVGEELPCFVMPKGDPRLEIVRSYEDAFCTFAEAFIEQVWALRSVANSKLIAAAQALLRSHDDWVAAHPPPSRLMPPARPGAFLHPSGLQPSAGMYYWWYDYAVWIARLKALVDGGSRSVLHRGAKGEPSNIDEHADELRKQFVERHPELVSKSGWYRFVRHKDECKNNSSFEVRLAQPGHE